MFLFGGSFYIYSGLDISPVNVPITLQKDNRLEVSFEARWSVNYTVNIDTQRRLPLQEQNCLLGVESVVPDKCADFPAELLLSWVISHDGEALASGHTSDTSIGYWGADMGKVLGSIATIQGKRYELVVDVGQTSQKLQSTNPRLRIEVDVKDLRWTYVWIALLFILGTFSAVLALIVVLVTAKAPAA